MNYEQTLSSQYWFYVVHRSSFIVHFSSSSDPQVGQTATISVSSHSRQTIDVAERRIFSPPHPVQRKDMSPSSISPQNWQIYAIFIG
jgi:hypothetical protein